jgi:hypothetical protein
MQKKLFLAVVLLCGTLSLLAQSGVLQVTKPSGGEVLSGGTNFIITWNSSNVDNIKIEYSPDNGVTWQLVTASYAASALNYGWTVPVTPTRQGKIRITDIDDNTTGSFSVGVFTIAQPRVSFRNLDTEVIEGGIFYLGWEAVTVNKVDLLYSDDEGNSYKPIRSGVPAHLRTFYWMPPTINTLNVHLQIRSVDDANVLDSVVIARTRRAQLPAPNPAKYRGGSYDGHSAASNLKPGIKFIHPAGGEAFQVAAAQGITWQSNGVEQLQLHFSADDGVTWRLVDAAVIALAAKLPWQVPNSPTSKGLLRLRSAEDTTVSSITAAPFIIMDRSLKLEQASNVPFIEGAPVPVTWSNNGITNIRLQYRRYGTTSWTTIKNVLPASINGFLWVPPSGLVNDSVYLRIQDITDPSLSDSSRLSFLISPISSNPAKYRGGFFDGHAAASNLTVALQLLAPVAGTSLDGFAQAALTWKAQGIDQVSLFYSPDSMRTWQKLAGPLAANTQQYKFEVPAVPTANMFFKILSGEDTALAHIIGPITVRNSYVQLSADSVALGSRNYMFALQWQHAGIQKANLHYRKINDNVWRPIRDNVPAALKSFIWILNEELNETYFVRIADAANVAVKDSIQVRFALDKAFTTAKYRGGSYDGHAMRTNTSKIFVTRPQPGEVVVAGTKYLITWNVQNVSDSVKIDYTTDNGLTWHVIQKAVDAKAGQYEWRLPAIDTIAKGSFINPARKKMNGLMGIDGKTGTFEMLTTLDNCRIRVSETTGEGEAEGLSTRTFIIAATRFTPQATVTASGSTQICAGDSVMLTASPGSRYQWSNGATTASIFVGKTGAYTVKVVYADSTNSISPAVDIVEKPLPKANIQPSGTVSNIKGHQLQLTADTGAAYQYQWYKDTDSLAGAYSWQYAVTDSGIYKVRVTTNGCTAWSPSVAVRMIEKWPNNNLTVSATDETCRSSNNGKISVKAQVTANYTATLKGQNGMQFLAFEQEVFFNNTEAGTYELCVSAPALNYSQCYTLIIKEPESLAVYTAIDQSNRVLHMELSGAGSYDININGKQLETSLNRLSIPLEPGLNFIEVSSDLVCQQTVKKIINVSGSLIVSPNPLSDKTMVYLPAGLQETSQLTLTDMQGRTVYRTQVAPNTESLPLSVRNLSKGVYILKVVTPKQHYQVKIVKQ